MNLIVGKTYKLRGVPLIYKGHSSYRGITRHFTYENGGCRDVGPDEISQITKAVECDGACGVSQPCTVCG
jgi:hypothetical protein